MKRWRSLSSSCGVWNTCSWVWIVGIWNTAKQDNMKGLCLFFSSMADSKSAYTTTGADISNRWFVNRRWVCCDSNSYWSHSSIWSRYICTSWFWTTVCELINHQVQWFHFLLVLLIRKIYPYSPFIIIIVLDAEVLLGSLLIHPFLVHVPIHGVIISECISKWGLDHIRQASFCDFAIQHSEELVSLYLPSLLHLVHEFRQRLLSLLTEFMSVPLVLEITFILCFASYDDISFHTCRIVNSLTCLAYLLLFVVLDLQG